MTEQYANLARTILNGAINSSVTSITVESASSFPSASPYRINIDAEIMVVTGGAGTTTWTVSRGQEGTGAVSHADGTSVSQTLTVQSLQNILLDAASSGTYASRPSTGNLYFHTDGPVVSQYNGSVWKNYGPIFEFTDPNQYSWSTYAGSSDFSIPQIYDTTPYQHYIQQTGAGSSVSIAIKNVPATPYVATACLLSNNILKSTNNGVVMGVLNSTGAKLTFIRTWLGAGNGTSRLFVSGSSNYIDIYITDSELMWFRIADDGTNLTYFISMDGTNFWQIYTESNTAWHGAIDKIGWGVSYFGGSLQPAAANLLSWKET
jgi:hypothetical protein